MTVTGRCYVVAVTGVVAFLGGAGPPAVHAQTETPSVIEAARVGNTETLRAVVQHGADVNARAGDGSTALLWAAYRDDLQGAEMLIRAGADVSAANDLGATPVWAAARNGSAAMVRALLAAGADPDAPLLLGEQPIITAARSGNVDVVRMLIERGAHVNARGARGQTPLMLAAAQRHPQVVTALLEHGADVHATSDRWDQLMAQSPHAHPEHQLVVTHGGNTALMFAVHAGDAESSRRLLDAGADVNAPSAWGTTPLAIAVYGDLGDRFVIREETSRSLIVFDRDRALAGEFPELITLLLERGADPNAGGHRFTPLIAAVLRQNEWAVAELLAHGAEPNRPLGDFTPHQRGSTTDFYLHRSWVGATPLWLAARFSTPTVVRHLLTHDADPSFVHRGIYYRGGAGGHLAPRREEITTTLMAAVRMGAGRAWTVIEADEAAVLETVRLLVEAGADVNAVGSGVRLSPVSSPSLESGHTALDGALSRGYESVAAFLISSGATDTR